MSEAVWHEPATLEDALALRAQFGDEVTVVAGGTFLGVLMRSGLTFPERFLSLRRIQGLADVTVHGGNLVLGALATHRQIELSPAVRSGWPMLASAFGQVASVRIRSHATVGGVLADADYASDPPAALVALDASVTLAGREGRREVPVGDFIVSHYETQLRSDELVFSVTVPAAPSRATYLKFRTRSSEDRPCVGVAAAVVLDAGGRVTRLRVVVGAVSGRPEFLADACEAARGQLFDTALARRVAGEYQAGIEPLGDLRGSARYRRRMIEVLVRRALEDLAA